MAVAPGPWRLKLEQLWPDKLRNMFSKNVESMEYNFNISRSLKIHTRSQQRNYVIIICNVLIKRNSILVENVLYKIFYTCIV